MNAGGVSKACKSNAHFGVSGKRVRNTLVTYPPQVNNSPKGELIHRTLRSHKWSEERFIGGGGAYGLSACWCGNGAPRQRRVAGVRARPASRGLRHCPDSYGRLQLRIFRNGRKSDGATPRAGRSPSGRKLLL